MAYCQVQMAFNPEARDDSELIALLSVMRPREVNPFLRGMMMAGSKASLQALSVEEPAERKITERQGGGE